MNGFINSPEDAEKAVHLQIKYGARVIKILASGGVASPLDSPFAEQVSPEEMTVIVEQAHMAGLKVAAHAENLKTILDALHAGVDSIEHGSDLNQEAIDFMKAHHVYLVPTVNVVDSIVQMTDSRFPEYMIRKGKALAAKHFASLKLALASGVTMAAGADDFYQPDRPAGLPSELVTDVKYGMTPQQALVAATTNSAALLGLDAAGRDCGRQGRDAHRARRESAGRHHRRPARPRRRQGGTGVQAARRGGPLERRGSRCQVQAASASPSR